MTIRRTAFTAAATAAVLLAGPATATADSPEPAAPVSYSASVIERSVVTTLEHGTFALTADRSGVVVHDDTGAVIDTLPLAFALDQQRVPIGQQISADGRMLTLTPDVAGIDPAALRPVASPLENQLAMNDLLNALSLGTGIGSLIGTTIGAVLGIGIGFAVSGAACAVISLGCVVAVLPIVSLTAGIGGLAGLVIGGGPVAVGAAFEYLTTLNAPPGGSKFAPQTQGKPGGAPIPDAPR